MTDQLVHNRRSKLWWCVIGFAVVIVVAFTATSVISVPYYAITPGSGLAVSSLITVPKNEAATHRSNVLLTDVELVPLRALTYLYYKFADSDAQIVQNSALTGTATAAQYNEQGVIDMINARRAATVVGLRALGYHIDTKPSGVVVYGLLPMAPSNAGLVVGQVITQIGDAPTPTIAALSTQLEKQQPGSHIDVRVHTIGKSTSSNVTLTVGGVYASVVGKTRSETCRARGTYPSALIVRTHGHPASCLGIEIEQEYTPTSLPFPVSIDAHDIIGPSAGLAFTLGVVQSLDQKSLTGGKRVAATGTMSINGRVGDVGGVAQKTVAVRNAGATVFIVPQVEVPVARAHAGKGLTIIGVTTFNQAITALRRLGGRISRPPGKS